MSIPNTKSCPRCGYVNDMNAGYCGRCGNPFDGSQANYPTVLPGAYTPVHPAPPPQSMKHRKKKFKWEFILPIIVALISLAGVLITKYGLPIITTPTNLITGGGFDNGITSCTNKQWHIDITNWCTDDPANIGIDKNNNGEGSTPVTSAKLVSNTTAGKDTHLFSPAIHVTFGKTYEITYYLHIIHIKSSNVFVPYIDEFTSSGDYVKGIYETGAEQNNPTKETIHIIYSPSSQKVTYTRFYFIVSGNSDTLAYVDNVTWEETSG